MPSNAWQLRRNWQCRSACYVFVQPFDSSENVDCQRLFNTAHLIWFLFLCAMDRETDIKQHCCRFVLVVVWWTQTSLAFQNHSCLMAVQPMFLPHLLFVTCFSLIPFSFLMNYTGVCACLFTKGRSMLPSPPPKTPRTPWRDCPMCQPCSLVMLFLSCPAEF